MTPLPVAGTMLWPTIPANFANIADDTVVATKDEIIFISGREQLTIWLYLA